MNKERRSELNKLYKEVETLKATFSKMSEDFLSQNYSLREAIEITKGRIESVKDNEQEAFDNMPESLQNGTRGEEMQTAIENMESAISEIEEINEALDPDTLNELSEKFDTVLESIDNATATNN